MLQVSNYSVRYHKSLTVAQSVRQSWIIKLTMTILEKLPPAPSEFTPSTINIGVMSINLKASNSPTKKFSQGNSESLPRYPAFLSFEGRESPGDSLLSVLPKTCMQLVKIAYLKESIVSDNLTVNTISAVLELDRNLRA